MQLEVVPQVNWAKACARRLRSVLVNEPAARLCLPTGATPRPFYDAYTKQPNIDRASVVLLDEFVLPSGDEGRCDSMLRRDLLDKLPEPPAHLRTWDTDQDLDDECDRMDTWLSDGELRLAIVGLGANGHVGTNEPGSPEDSRCRVVDLASSTSRGALSYGASVAPAQAVTLGIANLLEASEVWLIVTGAHKQAVLRTVVEDPISPAVPASLLRTHQNLLVIADDAAAGDFKR
ncbi:MAG: 6-phosphogluconolactonase [Acidimicrobiia bacterium]